MREEKNGTPKNKWSRIFRKKWFFPAMYLVIASLLLTVVVWYQSIDNQLPEVLEQPEINKSDQLNKYDGNATSVVDQQEVIKMPVSDTEQAEIVTTFFDHNADEKEQEKALILQNNRYYQSTGIDIAMEEDETFEVLAALSGKVEEVKTDPLLGNIVVLSHENDVVTYYSSLGEVNVTEGERIKQGDEIGTAGKSEFGKENGTHVHFEIRKNEQEVNPEVYFNQPISKLDQDVEEDEVEEDSSFEDEAEDTNDMEESKEEDNNEEESNEE